MYTPTTISVYTHHHICIHSPPYLYTLTTISVYTHQSHYYDVYLKEMLLIYKTKRVRETISCVVVVETNNLYMAQVISNQTFMTVDMM